VFIAGVAIFVLALSVAFAVKSPEPFDTFFESFVALMPLADPGMWSRAACHSCGARLRLDGEGGWV
jgi:hypothetical protein